MNTIPRYEIIMYENNEPFVLDTANSIDAARTLRMMFQTSMKRAIFIRERDPKTVTAERSAHIRKTIYDICWGIYDTDKKIETEVRPLIAEAVEGEDVDAIVEVIKALVDTID